MSFANQIDTYNKFVRVRGVNSESHETDWANGQDQFWGKVNDPFQLMVSKDFQLQG